MTPVSVPFRSMHLLPSNSTLKPWCADALPANPRRQPAATTTPASLILIAFSFPLEHVTVWFDIRTFYASPHRLSRQRRPGPWRRHGRPGELRRPDTDVGLHLAQLDRRSAVGPGDDAAERHLDPGDVAVVGIVDLRRNDADRRIDEAHLPDQQS